MKVPLCLSAGVECSGISSSNIMEFSKLKRSERDKLTQRFMDRLGLVFSSDPEAECNRESLKKLGEYVDAKLNRGTK